MSEVPQIDVEGIFLKHAGRPLQKKPYINLILEKKKPKKSWQTTVY